MILGPTLGLRDLRDILDAISEWHAAYGVDVTITAQGAELRGERALEWARELGATPSRWASTSQTPNIQRRYYLIARQVLVVEERES